MTILRWLQNGHSLWNERVHNKSFTCKEPTHAPAMMIVGKRLKIQVELITTPFASCLVHVLPRSWKSNCSRPRTEWATAHPLLPTIYPTLPSLVVKFPIYGRTKSCALACGLIFRATPVIGALKSDTLVYQRHLLASRGSAVERRWNVGIMINLNIQSNRQPAATPVRGRQDWGCCCWCWCCGKA